ncbi:Energy-coupling factor transporter ATP-binding protein EcfA1 [compost metagenome]
MKQQEDFLLSHVSVHLRNGNDSSTVLEDINLRIQAGEWVSIVGRNGSGKSTLAQLLAGVLTTYSGVIQRGFIGLDAVPYVMQQEQFFGDTPWEELVFILEMRGDDPDQIPTMVHKALCEVGLESLMHQPFARLSGGQRQLVAIAGCLAAKAPLLLLDEATSMLDTHSRQHVLRAASAIHALGTSVIWITHHMEELAAGTHVIALEDGRIAFDGSTTSFFYGIEASDPLPPTSHLSPCESLGFEPHFPIQVGRELQRQGAALHHLPLTADQLIGAMQGHAQ